MEDVRKVARFVQVLRLFVKVDVDVGLKLVEIGRGFCLVLVLRIESTPELDATVLTLIFYDVNEVFKRLVVMLIIKIGSTLLLTLPPLIIRID